MTQSALDWRGHLCLEAPGGTHLATASDAGHPQDLPQDQLGGPSWVGGALSTAQPQPDPTAACAPLTGSHKPQKGVDKR